MEMERQGATYRCTTGHDIPAARLEDRTEIVELDRGARVRICREHGAPIEITVPPGEAPA